MSSDAHRAVSDAHAALQDDARPDAVARQHGRGRLTARERIDRLSGGGRFVELGGLAAPASHSGTPAGAAPADGIVTGIAHVDGRPVAVAAFDCSVAATARSA